MTWNKYILHEPSTYPLKNKSLWYYFEYTGVSKGKFYGDHCFAGDRGFLTADVTHWQYDNGQEIPSKPSGQ